MFSRLSERGFRITEEGRRFLEEKALGGFRIPQDKKEKEHIQDLDKLDEVMFQALSYLTFEGDSFTYSKINKYIPPGAVVRLFKFGYIDEDLDILKKEDEERKEGMIKERELDRYFRMGLVPPDDLLE